MPIDELALSKPIVNVWLAAMVPNEQLSTWVPTAPVIAQVPGPAYAGSVQFTPEPAGSTSVKVAPATAPPALSVTVIVKPIGLPAVTVEDSGTSVIVRLPTFAGGNATATSLKFFVLPVIPGSTPFPGRYAVVMLNTNWQ